MKINIEDFTSLDGWTINSPSQVALNEFPEYIANRLDTSLIAKFDKADTIRTLVKNFDSIDVSNYEFLVFSMWSETKGKQIYGKNIESDFAYKIKINAISEYYIPVNNSFNDININIEDIDSIDRVEITALHNDTDSIILSNMIAEYEEMPIDLLDEAKSSIEHYLNRNNGVGILLGTVSAFTGDTEIDTQDYNYIDRYSVILISDETNSEIHQLSIVDDSTGMAKLGDTYDGKTIRHNYSDASLYLIFPVYINPDERNVRLPGICLWGFTPDSILRTGKLDTFIEAYKTDGEIIQRIEGHIWKYPIQIDCEARSSQLLAIMSKAVRDFIASEVLWINGRRHELEFTGSPTETKPPQGIDVIPKIQYTVNVEVIENIAPAETIAKAGEAIIDIEIGG